MDGEDTDYDGGEGDVADDAAPEPYEPDVGSKRDVEEALAEQRIKKGDPLPYRGLEGRSDSLPGGRYDGEKLRELNVIARQNGVTLETVVSDYHEAEKRLHQNFTGGIEWLAAKFNVDPRQVVAELGQKYAGPNAYAGLSHFSNVAQTAKIHDTIREFASDPSNKHFSAFRDDMAYLIQKEWSQSKRQLSLREAYDRVMDSKPTLRAMTKCPRPERY